MLPIAAKGREKLLAVGGVEWTAIKNRLDVFTQPYTHMVVLKRYSASYCQEIVQTRSRIA